jgi:hypothetical protein
MALLGAHGEVSFSREWAQPTVVNQERLVSGSPNSLDLGNPAFWAGDRVLLLCQRGIPARLPGTTNAPCPSGYSFYGGGQYQTGPAVTARTVGNAMYAGLASRAFYEQAPSVPLVTSAYVFIHRDELDNITFFSDEDDAINGSGSSFLPISVLDSGPILITPAPAGNYSQAIVSQALSFLSPILFEGMEAELAGDQVFPDDFIKTISQLLEDASLESNWKQVANLTSWVFETNVDVLDQNAIGQQFGESAKGTLKGAGSFNAIVKAADPSLEFSPSSMLRLMFITQAGARAKAKFVIADGARSQTSCDSNRKIYYETPLIISKSTVNTTVQELITMTIEFVATGKIRIASSPG